MQGSIKPYKWAWKDSRPTNPHTCASCGCLTTIIYGRNPERIPDDETETSCGSVTIKELGKIVSYQRFGEPAKRDKVGACLSCIPHDEVADNPIWYHD